MVRKEVKQNNFITSSMGLNSRQGIPRLEALALMRNARIARCLYLNLESPQKRI